MRIPNLNLKFVAHHGLAIRQKIAGHEELLGSDVIAVHRLLKNDIVEKLKVTAYAAFTDRLVLAMGIGPSELSMVHHSETYDHMGEIELWVHDLERRWQEEDSRKRFFVGEAGLRASVALLGSGAEEEAVVRMAGRSEPPLPASKNADGFLEGIVPIQIVG